MRFVVHFATTACNNNKNKYNNKFAFHCPYTFTHVIAIVVVVTVCFFKFFIAIKADDAIFRNYIITFAIA